MCLKRCTKFRNIIENRNNCSRIFWSNYIRIKCLGPWLIYTVSKYVIEISSLKTCLQILKHTQSNYVILAQLNGFKKVIIYKIFNSSFINLLIQSNYQGESSVAYICSRYYRAPELIFGATDYECTIDVWSVGKINLF